MLRSDQHEGKKRIMNTPVLMPQMGLEVSEATVLELLVEVGQAVAEGDALLVMETEKATAVIEAPRVGYVLALEVAVGDVVAVGAVVARIGDSADEPLGFAPSAGGDAGATFAGATANGVAPAPSAPATRDAAASPGPRLRAAPVARRAAAQLGIALGSLAGTGPRGRITLRDVESAAARPAAAPPAAAPAPAAVMDGGAPQEPLSGLRLAIARRMTQSQLIPQYELQRDIDASHLLAQQEAIAAAAGSGARVGVNDLLLQAIGETVRRHAVLATVFVAEPEPGLRRQASIGVGLAVATDAGLVVPVIVDVPRCGLAEIAQQRAALVAAARAGKLTLNQMTGAAITLSNLGGFGIDRFTAMLNPGESAIVAVGRTTERVVPRGRGITVIPTLTLTMTFDHRSIDGAVGATALGELADLLEGRMVWRP
jgi:pyruvate dehydrogenase E2 component (dihydrolipoamide acetyltransferase)